MRWYRDFLPRAPEPAPSWASRPYPRLIRSRARLRRAHLRLISCYSGSEGRRAVMEPLPSAAAAASMRGTMPFPAMQSLFDELLPGAAVVLARRLR